MRAREATRVPCGASTQCTPPDHASLSCAYPLPYGLTHHRHHKYHHTAPLPLHAWPCSPPEIRGSRLSDVGFAPEPLGSPPRAGPIDAGGCRCWTGRALPLVCPIPRLLGCLRSCSWRLAFEPVALGSEVVCPSRQWGPRHACPPLWLSRSTPVQPHPTMEHTF